MTVFFDKSRSAWRYDFMLKGQRHAKACIDPETRLAASSQQEAARIEKLLRDAAQKAASRDPDRPGWIYFVLTEDSTSLKVGWALSVRQRVKGLQTAQHQKLKVLGKKRGTKTQEHAFHELLAAHRIRGEWFHANEQTLAFVQAVVGHDMAMIGLRAKCLLEGARVPPAVEMVGLTDESRIELSP